MLTGPNFVLRKHPKQKKEDCPSGTRGTRSEIAYRYDNESEVPTVQRAADQLKRENLRAMRRHGRRERTAEL